MGMFDFVKVCLFSEVNGVVTLNGKPVAGVEVIRTAELGCNDKLFTDRTLTDDQGRYRFSARFTHSICKIAPVEPLISQKIVFMHSGKEYQGWQMIKHNYEINTELGRPIKLTCDLSHESKIRIGGYHLDGVHIGRAIKGICLGEGMSDEVSIPSESREK